MFDFYFFIIIIIIIISKFQNKMQEIMARGRWWIFVNLPFVYLFAQISLSVIIDQAG